MKLDTRKLVFGRQKTLMNYVFYIQEVSIKLKPFWNQEWVTLNDILTNKSFELVNNKMYKRSKNIYTPQIYLLDCTRCFIHDFLVHATVMSMTV